MFRTGSWEQRLYQGLRLPGMDASQRALTRALGEVGVEAEFFLLLTGADATLAGGRRSDADHFLQQLEVSCLRICAAASTLEVATQGYLSALSARSTSGPLTETSAEPWWPAFLGFTLPSESLELRLRRCEYSYRQVTEAHLSSNIEAIAEQLALTLHALYTLPPAGVLPTAALYAGLYELSSALQGHIVPHHITETAPESPGMLAGIAQLRAFDHRDGHSITADIAWAQVQLDAAREASAHLGVKRSPFSALAHLGLKRGQLTMPDTAAWLARSIREWEDTIAQLHIIARKQAVVRR